MNKTLKKLGITNNKSVEGNFFKRLKVAIWGRKTAAECILYTIVFLVFAFFALSYAFIVVWSLYSGLKPTVKAELEPFALIPLREMQFQNFVDVFKLLKAGKAGFGEMIFNSCYFALIGQALGLYACATVAYATTRYKFPGSKLFWYASFFMITIPLYGTGGAAYKFNYNLGLINSYARVLLNLNGLGMGYMYFNAMYKGMSETYFEAAEIDGANAWVQCFRIAIPLSMSLIGSLFVVGWIIMWNDYSSALIYHPKLPTFATGIYMFQLQMKYGARTDILYLACFISCVPSILLFAFFNKLLISNMSLGGIKE